MLQTSKEKKILSAQIGVIRIVPGVNHNHTDGQNVLEVAVGIKDSEFYKL